MKTRKSTIIFIICYLAYTSIYIARLNLSMASPGLIDARILDTVEIGMMGSIFSIIYAFGRFLNGQLSDRISPWIMISVGLVLAGISNICIGFFPPFIGILLLWGTNAFAQSMLWSSILCTIAELYDEETARKKTSYMVTSVAVGNIAGIILNTFIINQFGLRFAFIIPGGLTLLFSSLVLLTMRKKSATTASPRNHISMLQLLKNKEMQISLLPAILHGTMKDNISLWMTVYFVDKFNIDLNQSAYFVLLIPVMGFIGRMVYPACYKLCQEQEHKVSLYSFVLCTAAALVLGFGTSSPLCAAVCLSLIYTAVSLINTSFLSIYPIRFVSTGNVASVSGIMDFATYFGAGVSSLFYGYIIEKAGYSPMYLSWAAFSLISIIFLRMLLSGKSDRNS